MKKLMMAMLVGGCAVAHGQIVNGDFQEPDIGDGTYMTVYAGQSTIPGWTVVSGSVDLVDGFFFPDGQQTLDLNGDGPGDVEQTLTTIAGQRYRLELDYRSGSGDYRAYLLWNGIVQTRFDGNIDIVHIDRVIEAQGDDLLGFRGGHQDATGIKIDNIVLTAVPNDTPLTPIPEPSLFGLAAGIGLFAWAVWRKKLQDLAGEKGE